ncbi:Phosphatidylglycerophosphatase A [hydrothermal vent metagenome]|uniref:Phosphatidylglycerophosphatase A n=1 Tax=hydrothermal vent metagenome TaxID=652676 RepID=A0A3B0SJH1_9ZZZZ
MNFTAKLIATFFGVGLLRPAPGTWGSLAALPFGIYVLLYANGVTLAAMSLIAFVIGVWASDRYAKSIGGKDPSEVVIDEVAGQWLALAFVQPVWWQLLLAFVLFRFFDITKLWLIGRLEKLPGGWGIMADDMLAGLVAGLLILLSRSFLPL